MFTFPNLLLFITSIMCFLMGFAYLNNKAEGILMWSFSSKLEKIKDKEGFKRQQGKHSIVLGVTFLLVPFSIFLINKIGINKELLNLWFLVFATVIIVNAIQVRKFF